MGAGHRYRISRLPRLWGLTYDDYGGSGKAASTALVHALEWGERSEGSSGRELRGPYRTAQGKREPCKEA